MKKPVTILAIAAAACCALTVSGCSGTTILNTAALSSNWYSMTTYGGIQPTLKGEANAERAKYVVTHTESALSNTYYSVEFSKDGSYETVFYGTDFDYKSLGNEEYAAEYAAATDNSTVSAYYYKAEFDMPEMKFVLGSNSTEALHETMVTECYFLPVRDRLRPLYSRTSVVSHSPFSLQISSLDNLYRTVDRTYENFYSYNGGSVKTKITYGQDDYEYSADAKWQTFDELDETTNLLFDNNSLNIALRAMDLKTNLSQSISLFAPNSGVQNYTVAGSDTALGDELDDITKILSGKGLYTPTDEKPLVQTVAVDVNYIGDLTGVSQTYWFAAIDNPKNNAPRATMLKMSMPLSYGLGTLSYVLTELG